MIDRKELIKALDTVKPGLSQKEDTIEQSTDFAFMGNHIATYNDSISISYPFESGIICSVSAKELYTFINKLSCDRISMELKKNELIVDSGKEGKAGFRIDENINLPFEEIPKPKFKKIPNNLINGLKFCSFSTTKDNSKPLLTCVHVKDNIIESTDNFRATRYYLDKKVDEFLMPANSVNMLSNFNATKYCITDSWAMFKSKGAVFSCRVFKQEYPNISSIMDFKGKTVKFPKEIQSAVKKAEIFCEKEKELSSPIIEIKLEKNKVTVKGQGDVGWFKETKKTKIKEEFSFNIASDFFIDMLKINDSCLLNKKTQRIKFKSDEWEHVVLLLVGD